MTLIEQFLLFVFYNMLLLSLTIKYLQHRAHAIVNFLSQKINLYKSQPVIIPANLYNYLVIIICYL